MSGGGRLGQPGVEDAPFGRGLGAAVRLVDLAAAHLNHWLPAQRPWQNQLVQIGILGPLEVRRDDGGLVDVPGARLRGLLIALALRPGHVVPSASLIDWIWGQEPPADAANALQRLVSRLRKALPDGAVEGQVNGYRLRVPPDTVDAVRFERLVIAGRAGTQDGS